MRLVAAAAAAGLISAGLAVEARQSTQSQPTFRAAVDLVQLDVSVLDKAGVPVRDLTRADFTVLEDGKPQPIVAFTPVDIPDPPAPVPSAIAWTRDVPPDVRTNGIPPDSRLFVMVLDDALLPADPGIVANARKAARSVIAHLSGSDQMAIVFTQDGRASQNFTADQHALLAAVARLEGGHSTYALGWDTASPPQPAMTATTHAIAANPPMVDSDDTLRQGSLSTLRDVAEALTSASQRRKVLVYVSPGVPIDQENTSPQLMHGTGQGSMIAESQRHLAEQLTGVFREMQRANVTIYAIDPTGLDGLESYVRRTLESQQAVLAIENGPTQFQSAATRSSTTTTSSTFAQDLAHHLANNDLDFLETAAANTGGRAIVNTNDVGPGIDEMFRENSSYYSIGYQATDPGSGHMHRISVKVNRSDLEVRTRSGYYATDAKAIRKEDKASPLVKAIAGLLPATDLPMEVALAPFMTQGKTGPTGTVAIVLGMIQYAPSAPMAIAVDLQTNAYTEDGEPRGSAAQHARVRLFAGGKEDIAHYEVLSRIDLKPGRYQLRIGAFNESNNRNGSVFADVEVPDFVKAPLSLSGVLLESHPSLPAAPKDALAALGPVVPTAQRVFDQRDQVSAFFDLYEAASGAPAAVVLTTRILDDKGATVLDHAETVDADSFGAARAVDKHVALPLAGRTPGDYLLTITAASGKTTVTRDIRFSVK